MWSMRDIDEKRLVSLYICLRTALLGVADTHTQDPIFFLAYFIIFLTNVTTL